MSRTVLRMADGIVRPDPVYVTADGNKVSAVPGEMLAASPLAAGITYLRDSPRDGTPRGALCLMGACQALVRSGIKVRRFGRAE